MSSYLCVSFCVKHIDKGGLLQLQYKGSAANVQVVDKVQFLCHHFLGHYQIWPSN